MARLVKAFGMERKYNARTWEMPNEEHTGLIKRISSDENLGHSCAEHTGPGIDEA